MTTKADEKIDEIIYHLTQARDTLREVIEDEVWGWESYEESYQLELDGAYLQLRKLIKAIE